MTERPGELTIPIRVSAGDLIDRISILKLKCQHSSNPATVAALRQRLAHLEQARNDGIPAEKDLARMTVSLSSCNSKLWDLEDHLRQLELAGDFGPKFVEAARAIRATNDLRCSVKREIDEFVGAGFAEEKVYNLNLAQPS